MREQLSKTMNHFSGITIGVFVLGLGIGGMLTYTFGTQTEELDLNPACQSHYPFLRPDLDCESAEKDYTRIEQIQDDVEMLVEQEKAAGQITRASIVFRDLQSRRLAKVNAEERYMSGSLLKLPLAIAYYKLAEVVPSKLQERYQYIPTNANLFETWSPSVVLNPGQTYSAEELIAQMVVYSDNEAALLLEQHIERDFFLRVLSDLGVMIPTEDTLTTNSITPDQYAIMLRALYLSSYLNIDHSQLLLSLMNSSTFTKGLRAGVPDEIPLAHKFGERELVDDNTGAVVSAQLHDCGIIYKKDRPFLLCVMTEGKSLNALPAVIAKIATTVYNHE